MLRWKVQQEAFLPIGTIIRDHYVVEDLLGKGEGDLVYLVRDRWAAQNLYILKERINPDKQARDCFLVEGVVLKQLRHPALQRVYRVFEENAGYRVYMLMQYIAGQDLETMHRQWPNRSFSLPLTLSLMAPIVEAVTYLHSQHDPVIHRDINPSNIIVQRNKRTVLVNFGIDRGDNTTETPSNSFLCSPGYGAPEQYRGETNPSTDLYALAATFYTLLTGIVPPDARKRIAQLADKGVDPLIRADEVTSTVPGPIAEAIHRAMSIRSDERFSSVAQFWQALRGLPDSQSIKSAVSAISDADTLELQVVSADPPPVVSAEGAEELHEQPQHDALESSVGPSAQRSGARFNPLRPSSEDTEESEEELPAASVGADLSSPPPMYRPPDEDTKASEEQPQQEVSEVSVGPNVSAQTPIARLSANLLPIQLNLFNRIIALSPHWRFHRLRVSPAKFAERLAIPSVLQKLLPSPANFIHLYNHTFTQRSRKPAALLLLILALTLLLSVGIILWPRTVASHHPRPTTSTPIVVHKATSVPTKPTPPPSPKAGSIYMGTLHDLLSNTSTSISLTGMQLRLGNISGYLLMGNGSRGSGPFEGTFNAAQQHIQFVVLDGAGHPIYSFEGGVHPDGNIAGSYCALNQSGQCSGAYGLWSASPATALRGLPISQLGRNPLSS